MFAEALNKVAEEEKKNGSGPWVGASLPRKEEDRLLRGRGKFADDIKLREMLYLRFVRSPYAHARVVSVDTSAAEALSGVVCAITGKEIAAQTQPFIEIGPDHAQKIRDFPMAVGKALYQGEPVAAVVAESPSLADDAAELVQVEYEPLEPVVEAEQALTDDSILHEEAGTNRVWNGVWEYGDVERTFKEAAYIVDIDRLHFHRFSSTPLENNVVIAEWNPKDDRIYYWCNNSFPSFAIQFLAAHLNIHIDKIRVQTFDIGGSFGIKITSYPQMAVCALASKKAGGRPIKWVETRSEHMVSSAHGNERTFRNTRVALDKNGVVTAIDSRHIYDSGDYPKMLEVAKDLIGWDNWKKKQAEARNEKDGRMIGIGIGATLDSGTNNFGQSQIINPYAPFSGNSQGANCKLDIYGEVVVAVGSCPQGQGHETTSAQVVADVLNIHPDMITVRTGFDTERNVHTGFSGTYASQFAVSGLSAVHGAAQKLKAEMKRLAAFSLGTKEDDLEFGVGAQGPEIKAKSTSKPINY